MCSKLIIVPTPIGNLEDITLRALKVLGEADLILAEDTRKSSILLKKYAIGTHMESFHKFNEHQQTGAVLEKIRQGKLIALISDAGTPGISDPGFMLVRECLKADIPVECLPGATALIPALVNSGFPTDRFCFEGFLPLKKGRRARMDSLANETRTIILYESPFRLVKTLEQLSQIMGPDRYASVSRELTKIHEENRRGTLSELCLWYRDHTPKGEIVIVIKGRGKDCEMGQ
ncbi:MAG: Ribosomal RNA small subunit methyltransferase I [Bacteroidetes bacterium ADurb.Bin037]|nr:MAG: Ribosomal RNA small subunit methyltransferase I [Bacteroidetes bacterium ADurb.Bin037]HPW78230.1 16S rRNA (cytidine(1402)-2'-O)-methyltransferase [Bacteroidales bacterium]HQB55832.1 16S rRNA (cytidine(1402)-2'-O)-methyltransferase [Bacteroidales bacterium]